MTNHEAMFEELKKQGVSFFAGVPDSYLHGICTLLRELVDRNNNVIAANEGNAIGVAVGHYLATGEMPLVYMQNSGLGNAVNPLASLACRDMLSVPMLLLIGWRGDPFHKDHVQHKLQGVATPGILDGLEIPYVVLSDGEDAVRACVGEAIAIAKELHAPVALLSPKGVLSGTKTFGVTDGVFPSRWEAIEAVLDAAPSSAIFCATTGRASRELWNLRNERGETHSNDYLNVGSMGHNSSVALGIALAHPERPVIVLDGDAAVIMHMGALAINGQYAPSNLLHVVLNNAQHESVGGQPSAGRDVSLTAVAAACGYATVVEGPVTAIESIADAVSGLLRANQPGFMDVYIRPGIRKGLPGLEVDPKAMRDDLVTVLGE